MIVMKEKALILVVLAVVIGSIFVSGCTSDTEYTSETTEKDSHPSTTSLDPNDDEMWISLMKTTLISQGIDVDSIKVANGRDKGGNKVVIVAY
ncbi:MAG: hypothetical protein J7K57_02270, partial [Palaeococcus sp.]|uniref:hypothetical protein n=1 Tax=Palaeococcus sp. (in: euryarchaeotes) TaxID=2820298 RepID=UPI0025D083BB